MASCLTDRESRAPKRKWIGILLIAFYLANWSILGETAPGDFAFFESRIRPVLVKHCYECHGDDPKKLKGNLSLLSKNGMRTGGDSGPTLVSGQPGNSLIITALHWKDELEMPPKTKLPASIIADFEQWIGSGAPDPRKDKLAAKEKGIDLEKGRQHWAFQPLAKTEPGPVSGNQVDFFIRKKWMASGLQPNPEANRETLLRRLFMDLLGYPPTQQDQDRFEKMAHREIVDVLLKSPHFGERWARHWLDVARFAESNGYEVDNRRRGAFQFRDWVIRSLNDDLPFDQFVQWQIAGDQLAPNDPDAHIATGFIVAGTFSHPKPKAEELIGRYDELDDIVGTVGSAFLAQTLACARCHDHKFEPIPQGDYYAMAAAFAKIDRRRVTIIPEGDKLKMEWLPEKRGTEKPPASAPVISAYVARDYRKDPVHFLIRGDPKNPREAAQPGFIQVVMPKGVNSSGQSSHPRIALAEWLTDVETGAGRLTARVIVNRLWHHHFGQGIVATPNDFGTRGATPSHPDLLDFLATQLIENEWRLKPIHRLILNSETWRQSSLSDPGRESIDNLNQLFWRQNVRRLEAEPLRDSLLAVAGTLDLTLFGEGTLKPDSRRRAIYFETKRTELIPFLETFDAPSSLTSIGKRNTTTVAPQALLLLNDPLVGQCASDFANRIAGDDDPILAAYKIALSRSPTKLERTEAAAFIDSASLSEFCQALLLSNEFIYVR